MIVMESVNPKTYLMSERRRVVACMMLVGGMMGGYTFLVRGGVFCNAQTANLVMMGINFGNGNWQKGFYYLIPAAAYVIGSMISELFRDPKKKSVSIHWTTWFTGIQLFSLFLIGLIPDSLPNQIVQIAVNILASMQYNSFRKVRGIPMATTFCTNHVRQLGIWIVEYFKDGNSESVHRLRVHGGLLLCFILGVASVSLLVPILHEKSIWIALIPLGFVFCILLYADLAQLVQRQQPAGTSFFQKHAAHLS